MSMQLEYTFTLPRGYVDTSGLVHQTGRMRLATARDEIEAYNDPRVQSNEAYLVVALISRVISQLGSLPAITPQVIEGLFASDMAYLESLYQHINSPGRIVFGVACPQCGTQFQIAPFDEHENQP